MTTGIPVRVVLEKYKMRSNGEVKNIFYDGLKPANPPAADELADEKAYLKGIEKEFASQAEGILEGLQLSHLRLKPKKEGDEQA